MRTIRLSIVVRTKYCLSCDRFKIILNCSNTSTLLHHPPTKNCRNDKFQNSDFLSPLIEGSSTLPALCSETGLDEIFIYR